MPPRALFRRNPEHYPTVVFFNIIDGTKRLAVTTTIISAQPSALPALLPLLSTIQMTYDSPCHPLLVVTGSVVFIGVIYMASTSHDM